MTAWRDGWWAGARAVPSPNFGPRPAGVTVSLLVLHSISLPAGQYGGGEVERLFTNRLDADAHPDFESLRNLKVSAHFFLKRDGELLQFVSCDQRAWHAGVSSWRGRDNCNDYSVGIELEGLEGFPFETVQYECLARLMRALQRRHGAVDVAGHEHIAPGRKHDPGAGFEWTTLKQQLRWNASRFPEALKLV